MEVFLISETTEAETNGGERLKKAERIFVAATVSDVNSLLVQATAESLFEKNGNKAALCDAFCYNRQAREKRFWVLRCLVISSEAS